MPSREHRRAKDALQKVRALQNEPWAENYRSYVDRLGPAILRNGLGQALAGELAAAGGDGGSLTRAHRRLYDNLGSWLSSEDQPYGSEGATSVAELMDRMMDGGEDLYLRAHAEALAWLEWHKRFCRAYLRSEETESGDA